MLGLDEDSEGQMDAACEGQGQRLLELQGVQFRDTHIKPELLLE